MTNEEIMLEAIFKSNLFHSNTLSYFQQAGKFHGKIGDVECQLSLFDWLSFPGVGEFGCPFKAGTFFTNNMASKKLGVWLCVEEYHHRDRESGQVLAYFVGYKNEARFYGAKELDILIANYSKAAKSANLSFSNVYPYHTEMKTN